MPSYPWPVPASLRPYVDSIEGYDYRLDPLAVHHGLPSTSLTLIVEFDEPLDCGWLAESASDRYWVLVAGLHTRPARIRTHGRQHGIQVALTPLGARCLLGRPAAELHGELVHADAHLAALPPSLHERLSGLPWNARFAVLGQHLLALAARHDGDESVALPAEVSYAWELIVRSHGTCTVESIATEVGWSRRHLLSRFRAEYGLSPKQVARTARFQCARRMADLGTPLADVAYSAGYADQAHLNREWRSLTGMTPTQTLTEFT